MTIHLRSLEALLRRHRFGSKSTGGDSLSVAQFPLEAAAPLNALLGWRRCVRYGLTDPVIGRNVVEGLVGLWRHRYYRRCRDWVVVPKGPHENELMDSTPDPRTLAKDELTSLLKTLTSRETALSEERRALHGQIDTLRQELVRRLRDEGQTVVISGAEALDPGPDDPPAAGRPST